MQSYFLEFEPYTVICHEGDPSSDLYFLKSGKLMICMINGTEVKSLAIINPGEFIGELSFFDGRPRSSHIVAIEKCTVIQIPKQELIGELPSWFVAVGKNLTKKIRLLDHITQESHLRKSTAEENRPLPIEEQRKLYDLLTH
jgi:CRP/FNR family cyclic AMP-dependent transcriptional regulator